jgi:hypothetical protein
MALMETFSRGLLLTALAASRRSRRSARDARITLDGGNKCPFLLPSHAESRIGNPLVDDESYRYTSPSELLISTL